MKFLILFVCLSMPAFQVGNAASIPAAALANSVEPLAPGVRANNHQGSSGGASASAQPVSSNSASAEEPVAADVVQVPVDFADPPCPQALKGEDNIEGRNFIRWFDCTGLSNGDYPHPVEPTRFVTCVDGVYAWESECAACIENPETCPTGLLVFSAAEDMCVYSNCVTTPVPQRVCEDTKATCQGVGGLHLDCATKYEYINPDKNRGKAVEMSCRRKGPDGLELVWDQKLKQCQSCAKVFKKDGAACC